MEVLEKQNLENWASIFRFVSLHVDEIYTTPIFEGAVWYQPDSDVPISLFRL